MKKRKLIIIIFIVAILLIAVGCIIYFIPSNNNTKTNTSDPAMSEEEASQYIEDLNNAIINGATREELVKTLHSDEILDTYIMTGEDMYLLQCPNDDIIKKYSLEQYVTLNQQLASRLQSYIQNNFEYSINDISANDEDTTVKITYKTYYYNAYINDLSTIQNKLLERAGYDFETLTDSEELQADIYKSKVKAASILDNYLDNYVNESEFLDTNVTYLNNRIEDSGDKFISYLINLTGFRYSNDGNIKTEDDLNNILSSYDLSDPLAL